MSYREPVKREPRLWFIVLCYTQVENGKRSEVQSHSWVWAVEADDAFMLARKDAGDVQQHQVWAEVAVNGDEFADHEIKGPPKPREPK